MEHNRPSELGLSFKAQLPLKWRVIEDIDNYHMPGNHRFMNILPALDEADTHTAEGNVPNADYARLETKLDLILELLGELFQKKKPMPANIPFQLSARGITWLSDEVPPLDSHIELQIYLSSQLFIPLFLTAQVNSVEDMGATHRVQASFLPMEEALQEWLEKYIFKQHRREVALQHQRQE